MPIVPVQSGTTPSGATTTAATIISSVASDMLNRIGNEAPILLDYVNRVQLTVLRHSPWIFTIAAPQRFITHLEQTDYWIGATAQGPSSAVDTGLNLTDIGRIREGTVIDRSNFKSLGRTYIPPINQSLAYQDSTSRPGRPAQWRSGPTTPNIINIYPAPDNQNTYQPVPASPIVTTVAGGSLAQRTYFVKLTIVDSEGGESTPSDTSAEVTIPANYLAVVQPPVVGITTGPTGVSYASYKVYASTTEGQENLQTSNAIATTQTWTEPTSGLVVGASAPNSNTLETLDGYIIEFQYRPARPQLASTANVLIIPDEYKDIVVAGVNVLCAKFLRKQDEVLFWQQYFLDGLRQMVKDKNQFPRQDFMAPDPQSQQVKLPSIETVNLANTGLI